MTADTTILVVSALPSGICCVSASSVYGVFLQISSIRLKVKDGLLSFDSKANQSRQVSNLGQYQLPSLTPEIDSIDLLSLPRENS